MRAIALTKTVVVGAQTAFAIGQTYGVLRCPPKVGEVLGTSNVLRVTRWRLDNPGRHLHPGPDKESASYYHLHQDIFIPTRDGTPKMNSRWVLCVYMTKRSVITLRGCLTTNKFVNDNFQVETCSIDRFRLNYRLFLDEEAVSSSPIV